MSFVHCHLHTQFSLLDGYAKIDDVIKKANENNMPAIAVTDHGSLAGIYEFNEKCNKAVSKAPVITSIDDTLYVDKIITSSDLNKYTLTQYDNVLFFNEFTRPVYAIENVQIKGYHVSKNNPNNICFHIKTKTKEVKLWSWGFTETYKMLGEPSLVNMIGQLEIFNNMFVINMIDIEAV